MNEKNEELELHLSELLEADEHGREDAEAEARRKISAPYEIRVQTERDPIAEETKRFRELAEEVDDRYKKYD